MYYFWDMAQTIIPVAVVVLLILIILITGYVKASPDTAYIISGLRKKPKVLIGKAGIKIPFLEKKDELNLQLIPIDVKTSNRWIILHRLPGKCWKVICVRSSGR